METITLTTANALPLTDDLLDALAPAAAEFDGIPRPMLANWIADAVRVIAASG